jgi:hypothetical protein
MYENIVVTYIITFFQVRISICLVESKTDDTGCSTFGAFSMKPSKVSKRVFSSNVIHSSSSAVLALKSPMKNRKHLPVESLVE